MILFFVSTVDSPALYRVARKQDKQLIEKGNTMAYAWPPRPDFPRPLRICGFLMFVSATALTPSILLAPHPEYPAFTALAVFAVSFVFGALYLLYDVRLGQEIFWVTTHAPHWKKDQSTDHCYVQLERGRHWIPDCMTKVVGLRRRMVVRYQEVNFRVDFEQAPTITQRNLFERWYEGFEAHRGPRYVDRVDPKEYVERAIARGWDLCKDVDYFPMPAEGSEMANCRFRILPTRWYLFE